MALPDSGGDIIALLRLWTYLRNQRKAQSGNVRRLCRDEFINFLRVREWEDLHTCCVTSARSWDWSAMSSRPPDGKVLTAVLAGLLGHQVERCTRPARAGAVQGSARASAVAPARVSTWARGARFAIQPGSALAKNPPDSSS